MHRYFADLYAQRNTDTSLVFCIDPQILIHQIPGGMISNFRSQLAKQNALDKLEDALTEVTRVREDLGWPPLVTPTSQIVGTQAVMNVLSGERYKIIPNEVKDYFRGLYGRAPANVNPELGEEDPGRRKADHGAAGDTIAPMLPKATEGMIPNTSRMRKTSFPTAFCRSRASSISSGATCRRSTSGNARRRWSSRNDGRRRRKHAVPPQGPEEGARGSRSSTRSCIPKITAGSANSSSKAGGPAARRIDS